MLETMVQIRNVPSEFHRRLKARAAMAVLAARNVVAVLSGEAPLPPISGLNHSRV